MIKKINIATILVINDIKIYFRESYLGTLWQSLFLLVQVLAMGPLFASIFSAKIGNYTLFLSINLLFWNFFSNYINQSTGSIIQLRHLFSNKDIGLLIPCLKTYFFNMFILFQNFIIFSILMIIFYDFTLAKLIYFFVIIFLLTLTFFPIGMIFSLLSLRFKDFSFLISNITLFTFFVSPIIWNENQVSEKVLSVLIYNPLFHYLKILKIPFYDLSFDEISYSLYILLTIFIASFLLLILLIKKIIKKNYLNWLFI